MRKLAAAALSAIVLAGCSSVLPQERAASLTGFQNYGDILAAYDGIAPGKTTKADLVALGLDIDHQPNIEILSYVSVTERFLPEHSPITLQRAPEGVRRCVEVHNRCTGVVFRFQRMQGRHEGNVVADLLQFQQNKVRTGWQAEIILLLRDDAVVYKVMSGRPNIEENENRTRPLGPLQDVGKQITGGKTEP